MTPQISRPQTTTPDIARSSNEVSASDYDTASVENDETSISVTVGPLVAPVLRRIVGMLAARADFPLDKLDDAVLVSDLIAAQTSAHVVGDSVEVALRASDHTLALRVGPLRKGGARSLVRDAGVPGVGNIVEQLADRVEITESNGQEFLELILSHGQGIHVG